LRRWLNLPGIGIALSPVPIPYRKPKRGELRCELLIDGGVADGEGRIPVEQPELLDVLLDQFLQTHHR